MFTLLAFALNACGRPSEYDTQLATVQSDEATLRAELTANPIDTAARMRESLLQLEGQVEKQAEWYATNEPENPKGTPCYCSDCNPLEMHGVGTLALAKLEDEPAGVCMECDCKLLSGETCVCGYCELATEWEREKGIFIGAPTCYVCECAHFEPRW